MILGLGHGGIEEGAALCDVFTDRLRASKGCLVHGCRSKACLTYDRCWLDRVSCCWGPSVCRRWSAPAHVTARAHERLGGWRMAECPGGVGQQGDGHQMSAGIRQPSMGSVCWQGLEEAAGQALREAAALAALGAGECVDRCARRRLCDQALFA